MNKNSNAALLNPENRDGPSKAHGATKVKTRLFSLIAVGLTCLSVYAKSNFFPSGYCTWYAASEFNSKAPEPGINWNGNAGDWYFRAMDKGWLTSPFASAAEVGALIVWQDIRIENRMAYSGFGHVGVVRSIDVARKTITVAEMNWGPRKPGTSADQAITTNFGKVTTVTLSTSNLNRYGANPNTVYYFYGFIFPRKSPYSYIYRG